MCYTCFKGQNGNEYSVFAPILSKGKMEKIGLFLAARPTEGFARMEAFQAMVKTAHRSQQGMVGIKAIVEVVLGLIVLGTLLYSLWPLTYNITSNMTASVNGTDAGSVTIRALWPVALIIGGLSLVIGIIMYILDRAGLV